MPNRQEFYYLYRRHNLASVVSDKEKVQGVGCHVLGARVLSCHVYPAGNVTALDQVYTYIHTYILTYIYTYIHTCHTSSDKFHKFQKD